MSGLNATGTPSVNNLLYGRGALYFYTLASDLSGPGIHLGNAPSFSVTDTVETLDHKTSLDGSSAIDKQVVTSQKVEVKFTLDEFTFDNLALFLSGDTTVFANGVAIAGFAERTLVTSVVLGRWYDIVDSAGVRVFNINAADVTIESPNGTAKALTTDYLIDTKFGRIFIKTAADGGTIIAGNAIQCALAAKAGAGTVDQVRALTQTAVSGMLKFIGLNAAQGGELVEWQSHKVTLKADGDMALIGQDWATLGLTGALEANPTLGGTASPYFTVSQPNS